MNSKGDTMEHCTKSGMMLADVIRKAIADHEITTSEYEEVIHLAHADGKVDSCEQGLLKELQSMIANNTVRRISG
jgi:hypothetical protein